MGEVAERESQVSERLPTAYWLLWAGNVLNRAGGFVNFVLAFYLTTKLDYPDSFTGLVIGVLGGAAGAGAFLGGQLADHWGRRPTLLISQLATAASMYLLSLMREQFLLVLLAGTVGFFQGMSRPAFGAMMADMVPPASRMTAFGLNYWGNNIAAACAATIGGLTASWNFELAFVVDAVSTVVAAVVIAAGTKETHKRPAKSGTGSRIGAVSSPWRDRLFLAYCAMTFGVTLIFAQHLTTLPLSVAKAGHSSAVFGLLISINTVMIAVGQPILGRFLKNRDPSNLLFVGFLLVGLGFGLTAFAGPLFIFAASIVVWTLGEMVQSPASGVLVAGMCRSEFRGRYQAAASLFISAGMFLAPIAGGAAMSRFGQDTVWIGCAIIGVLCAAVNLAQRSARNDRLAAMDAI